MLDLRKEDLDAAIQRQLERSRQRQEGMGRGRAAGGLAARPEVLRFAVAEVAELDDGQSAAAMVDQHVVQLHAAKHTAGLRAAAGSHGPLICDASVFDSSSTARPTDYKWPTGQHMALWRPTPRFDTDASDPMYDSKNGHSCMQTGAARRRISGTSRCARNCCGAPTPKLII